MAVKPPKGKAAQLGLFSGETSGSKKPPAKAGKAGKALVRRQKK